MTEESDLFRSFNETEEWWTTWKPVTRAVLLTVPLFVVAVAPIIVVPAIILTAGRWPQVPLLILFPYHMLAVTYAPTNDVALLTIVIAYLTQYPAYAVILRAGARLGHLRSVAALVALVHLLIVSLAASTTRW